MVVEENVLVLKPRDLLKFLRIMDHNMGKWSGNNDNNYYVERKTSKAKCYLVHLGDRFIRVQCTSLATSLKV